MARGIRSTRREVPMAKTLVIYNVDVGTSYQEKVTHKKSVLSPTTFTPTKSGYTFTGWKLNGIASSDVLVNCIAEGKVMYLYAVFQKDITVTKYNASNSPSYDTKQQYYNNSDILNPTFTLSETAIGGWSNAGWTDNASGYSKTVNDGGSVTLSADKTYYSLYTQTITVTYYNNSVSAGSTSGTRVANIHNATTYSDPTFNLTVAGVSGWNIRGWSTSSSSSGTISYNSGANFTRSSNITLYASWSRGVTVTYYNGSSTAGSSSGTAYRGYKGDVAGASFTLYQAAKSYFNARGWTTDSQGGNKAIAYGNGATFTRDSNVTLYGCYYRTVTMSYAGNGADSGSTAAQTGTAYWHSTSGFVSTTGTTIPKFTVPGCGYGRSNYSFVWWNSASDDTGSKYIVGSDFRFLDGMDHTLYAIWVASQVTFNYTGNMQSFSAKAGINYLIQVYGAAGGDTDNNMAQSSYGCNGTPGGWGGYASGYRKPSSNETWYIGVGGQGGASGGFNGGGNCGDSRFKNGGGGASHVGLSNATLLNTSPSNLLIAAGGGGGGGVTCNHSSHGGYGGGTSGGNATSDIGTSGGGSHSGPGTTTHELGGHDGGYGYGGSCSVGDNGAGGGGGYYGGASGKGYNGPTPGGGGCSILVNVTSGSETANQRAGNGVVIITVA